MEARRGRFVGLPALQLGNSPWRRSQRTLCRVPLRRCPSALVREEISLISLGGNMTCRLWKETLALSEDYLLFCFASTGTAPPPPSESAAAMRRLAQDMERQYYARFQALAQSFLAQCEADACAGLRRVMEELVGDGQLNWGRVVSLFTFTGVLARQLQEKEGVQLGQVPGGSCRGLAETIADYLGEEKRDWLLENGGWEGFCKFSSIAQEVNQESSMKTALFAAAGVGIAGLTFLLVR